MKKTAQSFRLDTFNMLYIRWRDIKLYILWSLNTFLNERKALLPFSQGIKFNIPIEKYASFQ